MTKKVNKKLIVLTLILTSFLLWLVFADYIKKISVKNILKTSNNSIQNKIFWNNEKLNLDKVEKIYSIIKKDFYDSKWIKKEDLIDGASKWLVNALWDKHSEYFTKKERKQFENMMSGDFEWIWAVVDKTDLWVKIERILKWSPAKKYWLKKGDIIIEANWVKLEKLNLVDAVAKIKWPAKTKVKLKILRVWEKKAIEKEVVRWKVKIPSVEEKYFDNVWGFKIWYIALNIFGEDTASDFKKSLKNLQQKNIDWLIIDLRWNWGGYLTSAVEILSNFIEKWKLLVTAKYKNKIFNEVYNSIALWKIFNKKIVILVDWNTASASEITSWALHDYKKAILVWEKTYGKGSVQKPYELWDGTMFKITIAKWFTPNDKNIDWEWIKPDIEVKFKKQDYDLLECKKVWKCDKNMEEKDFKPYDRQLEKAKKVLIDWIKTKNIEQTINNEIIKK